MAEKEERISVIVYEKDPCENCPGNPMTDCQVCEKDLRYDGSMTRTEAINRMAKANWIATICAKNQCVPFDITKEQWDEEWEKLRIDYKKVYYAGAEAALDALLSSGESND